MKRIIILIVFVLCCALADAETVRVRPRKSKSDASHSYFLSVLELALSKTESDEKIDVVELETQMNQARVLAELKNGGKVDVAWVGTDKKREEELLPIRIPLVGGLLGYRVPVIKKEMLAKFSQVKTIEDLKKYRLVQGMHWPDSDILEDAGLNVLRVAYFGQMYELLKNGRVDFFPRGLNEVFSELSVEDKKDLVAFESILISYKFPMYFFVNKSNEKLARRIETGLLQAIDDGDLLRLMKEHPVTASIFPLSKYKDSIIIELENNNLPDETPLDNKKLWLEI